MGTFIQPIKNAKFRLNYAYKNAYFLEKNCIIAAASETPPLNPHWLPAARGSAPGPPICFKYKGFNIPHFSCFNIC